MVNNKEQILLNIEIAISVTEKEISKFDNINMKNLNCVELDAMKVFLKTNRFVITNIFNLFLNFSNLILKESNVYDLLGINVVEEPKRIIFDETDIELVDRSYDILLKLVKLEGEI